MKKYIQAFIKSVLISLSLIMPTLAVDLASMDEENLFIKLFHFMQMNLGGRKEALTLVLVLVFIVLVKKKSKFRDRRESLFFYGISFLLGVLVTCMGVLEANFDLTTLYGGGWYMFRGLIKTVGYTLLFAEISSWLAHGGLAEQIKDKKIPGWLCKVLDNKKSFIITAAIIFLLWMPYFILCYPGNMTLDARDEIAQVYQQKDDSWTYHT
ncbi:MAG: hypothetical protein K6G62_07445, partial [Eubacterium sp.]|nr:hypothetical protein [Eubacterium sp.]